MSTETGVRLLVHSAQQIVQVVRNGERLVVGKALSELAVLNKEEDSSGLSIVVSSDGLISDIGTDEEILEKYKSVEFPVKLNAAGKCILPGLVDAHTHPVWAGDRVKEFSMKLAGLSYMDIHKIGGGIYYTVEQTQRASKDTLLRLLLARLGEMLRSGTTLVEAKSGYGLETETEMKMLMVIEEAKKESPIEISSTFCGAHAVPKHMTSHQATEAVLNEQLPALAEFMAAGTFTVDNIDVFCEKGVFDLEQSRRILTAGKEMGLQINFHGDELNPMEAAKMGAELGAKAISHLEEISTHGMLAMAQSGTVAVVLPTTAYMLRLRPPPVKRMIEAGVPIALGTDFNPNAFCYSMPLVMHLACVLCGMSMEQALQASTINAAAALGKADTHGSLEKGKFADMLIINAPRWEHLIYQMGAHSSLIDKILKKGKVVYENTNTEILL
ncbi:putative imidazolonepropionase [Araneus ventricosus]|uniref:Probable imidazolonepropionase n=1 Tax=Araneus ventricosus TaxID=182803 RepID=A0A4Y2IP88_ARAVE|nr:putative imidazolonepropionase [Araneus ventricosus]